MSSRRSPGPDTREPDIDTLQASLFYLMSRYARQQDSTLAAAVADHINRLLHHPLIELLPVQRAALVQQARYWQVLGSVTGIPGEQPPLLQLVPLH